MLLDPRGHAQLLRVRFGARKFVRALLARALKTQLQVIEPGTDKFLQAFLIKRQTGRNQTCV